MKNLLYFMLLLLQVVFYSGCRDFIEVDLENKTVNILAPSDNMSSTTATVNFYWETLEGARSYHLQLVKPSFDNIVTMLADTNVSGTSFSIVLTPGNYQWRIRGQNGSTQTLYTVRSFTIDSTSDLSSQTLVLQSPDNNYATNAPSVTFSCYELYNSPGYRFAMKTHTSDFSGTLLLPESLESNTERTFSISTEGYYDWGMRGESATSSTPYAFRSIYIDRTAPGSPLLNSPADGNTSGGPSFTLSWTRASDTGSPLHDSIYIYSDAALTTLKRSYKVSSGTSLSDTLSNGTYYWRVKSVDQAGNTGSFSVTRWFKLI